MTGDKRFTRFIFVGLLNTLFGLGAYSFLVWIGLPIWTALIGAGIASIGFNFFTTGHLVFSDIAPSRLPRFVGAYLVLYVVNYLSIRALVLLHLGPITSQVILTPAIAMLSFFVMSRLVFSSETVRSGGE
ncbi:GtrA family protein [Dyella sp. EPa41]|uniref:GtrA family protein n=1 Tax=Dyella sp. EPa41 TaxID=1561194 RepID=UPI001915CDB8|nr:GtrA family protein [Dyella sp. EPa41]